MARVRTWISSQGSALAASCVAARCIRASPNFRLHYDGWRDGENGGVWLDAVQFTIIPGGFDKAAPYVMALAVIGTIYGALIATVQNDLKRLVAYSSLSHLGLVVLGIFAATELSLQGSLYQMLDHGLSTGAMFVCVA